MAITNTRQAKRFTAGAPNIMLMGDLRPLNTMAYGGRAQYGLGSFVKSIGRGVKKAVKGVTKSVKKFAKSDLGKAAMMAAAAYYAPAMFGGTTGFGPGTTYGNFFRTIGQGSQFAGTGMGGGFDRLAFNAARTSGGNTGILSSIGKAVGDIGLSKKGKGTLASFAIGSLGSAALSAAEAGGLEYEDPNAQVDLDSLKGYLTRGYKNLNPNATDDEVFQFVQENTAEYRADGGRIGYDEGGYTFEQFMKDKGKVDAVMGEKQMRKLYEEMMRKKKVAEQKTMAAEGGRIGFKEGKSKEFLEMDMAISKSRNDPRNMTTKEIVFAIQDNRSTPEMFEELMLRGVDGVSSMMIDEIGGKKLDKPQKVYQFNPREVKEGGVTEELLFRLRESNPDVYGEYSRPQEFIGFLAAPPRKTPKSKAEGGRISYAMGDTASENAMQAAGIEGLPVRQNKAGVTELDLRETGGFVPPVGIKEKADDIPAMLSNNEFVFTADAVRAAGGGNINKGAQIMYDTMKQLESRVV